MFRRLFHASLLTIVLLLLPTSLGLNAYVVRPVTLTPDGLNVGTIQREGESIDTADNDACGTGVLWDEDAFTAAGEGYMGVSADGNSFDEVDWSAVRTYRTEIVTASIGGFAGLTLNESCASALAPGGEVTRTGLLWFHASIAPGVSESPYNLTYTFLDNDGGEAGVDAPPTTPTRSLVASPTGEIVPAKLDGSLSGRSGGGDFDAYGVTTPTGTPSDTLEILAVSFAPDCGSNDLSFELSRMDGSRLDSVENMPCEAQTILSCLTVGPTDVRATLGLPGRSGTGYTLRAAASPVRVVDVDGAPTLVLETPAREPSDTITLLSAAVTGASTLPPWCDEKSEQLGPALLLAAEQSTPLDPHYHKAMGPVEYVMGKLPPILP